VIRLANVTIADFITYLKSKIGCGYTYGCQGETLTSALLAQKVSQFGASNYYFNGYSAEKWYGYQVFDCSGLIWYFYNKNGISTNGARTAKQIYETLCDPITFNELQAGDLLFKKGNGDYPHVGVYLDKSKTIEAKSTKLGVVNGSVPDFNQAGRLKIFKDQFAQPTGVVSNYNPIQYFSPAGNTLNADLIYGRRYRILISDEKGTAFDVSDMHCEFSCERTALMQPNYSEVIIYNLDADTENKIIREGMRIVIEAGYEGSQYGKIFDGYVIQPVREKVDGTTFKLTLRSIDGDRFMAYGFVNMNLGRSLTRKQVANEICAKATNPIQVNSISEGFTDSKLSRNVVLFGYGKNYLNQLAQSEKAQFYIDNGKVNIIKVSDVPTGQTIELSPSSGLIGVPTQTTDGITAVSLLNPRIQPNTWVHIDNSLIRAKKFDIGEMPRALDIDGLYRVISVRYKGDTRGQNWYTEFDAISQSGFLPTLATNGTISPF